MPSAGKDLEVIIKQEAGDRIMGVYRTDFEQEVRKAVTNQDTGMAGYDLGCEMKKQGYGGDDLSEVVKENVGGFGGIDLGTMVRKAIVAHTIRKGCRWVDGAAEAIIASPEFTALAEVMEKYEICNADAEAGLPASDLASIVKNEVGLPASDLASVMKDDVSGACDLAAVIKDEAGYPASDLAKVVKDKLGSAGCDLGVVMKNELGAAGRDLATVIKEAAE